MRDMAYLVLGDLVLVPIGCDAILSMGDMVGYNIINNFIYKQARQGGYNKCDTGWYTFSAS